MKVGKRRPSPAIAIAIAALVITLTGTAYAALGPHSVSSRQIKPRAVTTKKFADGAVTTAQVAKNTLVGKDFDVSNFETVPQATSATSAGDSKTITAHYTAPNGAAVAVNLPASCPSGTLLIRGVCYDSSPLGPIVGVKAAADACGARGGYLPSPTDALTLRGAISLGNGEGNNSVFTDSFNANTQGVEYVTTVVNDTGAKYVPLENVKKEEVAEFHYICAYHLVH